MNRTDTAEYRRLEEARLHQAHWQRWGPYVSERQWGTVREDYSDGGTAWEYLPHDHARSRAYRWGEDGILGISDNHQRLCFAVTLWNGHDPILKERLFGLTGNEGNHGEDVKEYYHYLDSTPTHSYMRGLYRYPQAAYPYEQLVDETRRRTRRDPEFELIDTGIFEDNRFFDVTAEYAKGGPNDILIRLRVANRGPEAALLHLLPTLWFRNAWSWKPGVAKPLLEQLPASSATESMVAATHESLGSFWWIAQRPDHFLFTDNETNHQRLFGTPNYSPYVKDGINNYLIHNDMAAINPRQLGTKASAYYRRILQPGETWTVKLRLTDQRPASDVLGESFDQLFVRRKNEADEFYAQVMPASLGEDARRIQRQAFAGMLWGKQVYNYVVREWLDGDPNFPPPPDGHRNGRNKAWGHLYSDDVLSMPDKWEYPWFAAWDLAFHCIPLAMIDPEFAKRQLMLLTREWYMHPNGQLPAYEWAFGDVNPPVHAWAAYRVFKLDRKITGKGDLLFLERVFQKLLLNFTWWVNRKDAEGNNIFQGGFLGLDNIGVFDRNMPLPGGTIIEQSDGTSWMAMYSLNMLKIAIELAHHNPAYEDIASKFFEHFLYIAEAIRSESGGGSLWDEDDGFFYDMLHFSDGSHLRLKVRSGVGLIPLFAVETLEVSSLFKLPGFSKRMAWFLENRPDLAKDVMCNGVGGACERRLLSIVTPDMLRRILSKMLDESEFLSPYGVRALSKYHRDHPYRLDIDGHVHVVSYEPAESTTGLFGGNSNWRGPVWMPLNFLILESLQKFHHYLGDGFRVECPVGSGRQLNLAQIALELGHRLMALFMQDSQGRRPVFGGQPTFQSNPLWHDDLLFYEYFHGDNGAGIGASHQTGWTGLVAKLLQQCGEHCGRHPEAGREARAAVAR
ncbi:MAG TPA: glucosidase [Elusimicrobiota bacterium]|nr:glucosidase [Elusimicrobiota bacterium]